MSYMKFYVLERIVEIEEKLGSKYSIVLGIFFMIFKIASYVFLIYFSSIQIMFCIKPNLTECKGIVLEF